MRPARTARTLGAATLIVLAAAPAAFAARPDVAFVTPPAGATLTAPSVVEATARHASGISRVDFYVDGKLRWTERYAPYRLNGDDGRWNVAAESVGSHTLRVRATAVSGESRAVSRTVTVARPGDTTAPTAPGGLAVTSRSDSGVTVGWTASTDDVGVTGYRVRRDGGTPVTVTGTSYAVTGLTCGTAVAVGVAAVDAAGNVSPESTLAASTADCPPPADTTAPSAPAGLQVTARAADGVTVGWTAASDDVGVTGYLVTFGSDAPRTVTGTSASVSGRTCGTDIPVTVVAVDAAGNRSAAATTTARTADCPPPPSSTAQVYLSPTGSDSAACTATAPCRTLPRGYQAARSGDVVEMAGGTYPGGTIAYDSAKASGADILMRPAAGASVTVSGELYIRASRIEIRGIATAGGWQTFATSTGVTIRDVDSKHLFINSSQDVKVLGGRIGPGLDYHPIIQAENSTPPRNILVEGVEFHDWTRSNDSVHTECLQIGAGDGIVIRNNRFENCHGTGNLHIAHWGTSPQTRNVTVENNFFDVTGGGYYSIQASAFPNLLIRNNSARQGILLFQAGTPDNVRVIANLAPMGSWECMAGVTYRNNVWFHASSPAKCHSSDTAMTGTDPGWVNPGAVDLHLRADSPVLGKGSPDLGATVDIDGDARPLSGAPDPGADER